MRRIRLTGPARHDIAKILRRSAAVFGNQTRDRYRRLSDQALQNLGEDTGRAGVRSTDDIRPGYFIYHLRSSRKGPLASFVQRPRHLIAFYVDDSGAIIVARVFHERQMLARHLPD